MHYLITATPQAAEALIPSIIAAGATMQIPEGIQETTDPLLAAVLPQAVVAALMASIDEKYSTDSGSSDQYTEDAAALLSDFPNLELKARAALQGTTTPDEALSALWRQADQAAEIMLDMLSHEEQIELTRRAALTA